MLKIRRPLGRLIFNMGIAIPGKTVFLIETAPWAYMGYTANIIIKDTIHIFASISKIMRIWLMGRRNREHWLRHICKIKSICPETDFLVCLMICWWLYHQPVRTRFENAFFTHILMAYCKTAVTPLLMCGVTAVLCQVISVIMGFFWQEGPPRAGVDTLRLRQNGCYFAVIAFKCIFLNENVWIFIEISLKYVLWGRIDNNLALVLIMAWRWTGNKPLSEPMMVSLLMHICVTRPQWVNDYYLKEFISAVFVTVCQSTWFHSSSGWSQ